MGPKGERVGVGVAPDPVRLIWWAGDWEKREILSAAAPAGDGSGRFGWCDDSREDLKGLWLWSETGRSSH